MICNAAGVHGLLTVGKEMMYKSNSKYKQQGSAHCHAQFFAATRGE